MFRAALSTWLVLITAQPSIMAGDLTATTHAAAPFTERWVYLSTNLLVDKNVDEGLTLAGRAAAAGYNGLVLTDSKFMRWGQLPDRYLKNVQRFRARLRELKLACIVGVAPIGYSDDLLAHDPNLAEGLPAVAAPFVAHNGRLVPDDPAVQLRNGGFEEWRKQGPAGWRFVDQPGQISHRDEEIKRAGRASLRMEDIGRHDPQHGHGRVCQTLTLRPFSYYHVSAAVRTADFETPHDVRLSVIGADGAMLNFYEPPIERTQDWRDVHIVFNSLENTEVSLYLGVWGGRGGKIWWDDVRIEPAGLVNVVRRPGAPLRLTSADGRSDYVEDRDFRGAADPKLGADPYPGAFSVWHEPPAMTLPAGSRIADGQRVLLSCYHAPLIHQGQVMCCMAEEKIYELLAWQIRQVHENVQPDGYFLQHDEIRVQGWDESCRRSGKTPGQLLADNVRRCAALVRQTDPGKPVYVWSDMFDPFHNAKPTGRYYLVRGEGSWQGSWAGLDKELIIVNWNSMARSRSASLAHFAARGQRQILAGYYDGPVAAIRPWLDDARQVSGVMGCMYTTWRHKYNDLESFARECTR